MTTRQTPPAFQMFFLAGLPKSGTTWVMNILNSLEEVSCLGEGRFFASRLKGVPSLYEALEVGLKPWYEFIALRKGNWLALDKEIISVNRHNYLPAQHFDSAFEADLGQVLRTVILQFMEREVVRQPIVRMVGDKTPVWAPEELVRMAQVVPDAKIVYMQRNVKDFIVSLLFHYWRATRDRRPDHAMSFFTEDDFLRVEKYINGPGLPQSPFVSVDTAVRLARLWQSTNDAARGIASKRPEHFLSVAYEEMMLDPHVGMDRVYAFLGLSPDPQWRCTVVERNSKETIQQGENSVLKAHVRSGEEGDWQNYLSEDVIAAIDAVMC